MHTTEDVLAETAYRLRREFPEIPGGVIVDLRKKVAAVFDEILPDFDASIDYSGADPDDRHVHAGAIASGPPSC